MASFEKNKKQELTREQRMCDSKKFFRLIKHVKNEIQRGIRKGYLPEHASYYKCEYCVGYHVTSKKANDAKNPI